MITKLATLYAEFRVKPFPKLGKAVGNFPLYDGYFSGYVSTYLQGGPRPEIEATEPDDESAAVIARLRAKANLSSEEQQFLDYVALMDRIRTELYKS